MTTHAPEALPQISLNGRSFYIRSDSLRHGPVPKDVQSMYTLSGARRRLLFIHPKQWAFKVACRSDDDRDYLEALVSDMSYASYTITFLDGITGSSYDVIITKLGDFRPVMDNTDAWDVDMEIQEWT